MSIPTSNQLPGKAAFGSLFPVKELTLLIVALAVDNATGFRGILKVND